MEDGEKYRGPKTLEAMQEFILSKILVNVKSIKAEQWDELKTKQWVLFLCGNDNANCPEMDTIKKVAAALVSFINLRFLCCRNFFLIQEGLLQVGIVRDEKLCKDISNTYTEEPVVFWEIDSHKIPKVHFIEASDFKDIVDKILNILPTPPLLDENKFHVSFPVVESLKFKVTF